jgi:hypothetical protein
MRLFFIAFLGTLLILGSGCATSRQQAQNWEYKVVRPGGAPPQLQLEPLLNKLGAEGWILVTRSDEGVYILKRPKR